MKADKLSPVLPQERAEVLDVLRGIAVLGIFVSNAIAFSRVAFLPFDVLEQFPTAPLDIPLMFLDLVFIDGKFYTLFSLLFGIGFSIILTRNEQRGLNPIPIFYRRLFVLMLFGLAHLFLLWEGDILLLYGLVGLLLPLFRRVPDQALLRWSIVLIALPVLIDVLRLLFHWSPGDWLMEIAMALDKKNGIPSEGAVYAFYLSKEGAGYQEVLKWCQGAFFWRYEYILDSNRIPKVLGIFLIGLYVGRKRLFLEVAEAVPLLKRIRFWGFWVGLPTNFLMAFFYIDEYHVPESWMGLLDTLTYAVGVVPLSLAYTASLTLMWHKSPPNGFLKRFGSVGRMALTNYLSQSIIAAFIFWGIGLGLGGHIGYSVVLLFVVGVYALQVIWSRLWLKYFEFGPVEWVWRQLTYLRRLPIRRRN